MKELSIIIVNYNTKDLLRDCLNSVIENTNGVDYEIIVIDNASKDGSVEMLKKEFLQIKLICNKENVGFAIANNQGIKIAKGENVLLLNSDTLILDNCFYKISEFVKTNPDAGIIGCKVLNPDKTLQYSCYHAPSLLTELVFFTKEIIKNIWDPITYYKYMKYWDHNEIREVDCISGCFLWINKKVFREVGFLDEKFFMYYEDAEFCRRVKARGNHRIYYYPGAKIVHLRGMSCKVNNINTLKYCYESARYYLTKCYGNQVKRIFCILNRLIWGLEIFIFSLLRFNKKFNKKFIMLKKMVLL